MVNNWLNIIQDSWLPPTCILCDSHGFNRWDICYDCYCDLPRSASRCYQCAINLAHEMPINLICGDCQITQPAFDRTLAFFNYQHTMRYLIVQLKFHKHYKIARLLGTLLASEISKQSQLPQAIIPVPLHPKRYRERHFNQSIEIAKTLSNQLQLPLLLDYCQRDRDTAHQTDLNKTERVKNMHNAFSVSKPIPVKHIALVDDVMTTGSTLHELAAVLKQAGVQQIDAWVCERT